MKRKQTHVRVEGFRLDRKQTLPRCCFQDTRLKLRHRKGERRRKGSSKTCGHSHSLTRAVPTEKLESRNQVRAAATAPHAGRKGRHPKATADKACRGCGARDAAAGSASWCGHCGGVWGLPNKKLKIVTIQPADPTHPEKTFRRIHAAQPSYQHCSQQPRMEAAECPLTGADEGAAGHLCTRFTMMPLAAAWTDLEMVTLSEVRQTA